MSSRPLFSILHPSARPDKWEAVRNDWMAKCVDPSQVQYILCIDQRWGFVPGAVTSMTDSLRIVENTGRRCYVDAVATAAKAATGQILIVIADDQFAEDKWDLELRVVLGLAQSGSDMTRDFVIEVSTGTPDEHNRGIFVMPIVSRARYERLGYLFYPEYESMYADNDLCSHAQQDGVVIDARHLMFPHKHPMFNGGKWNAIFDLDEAYKAQNDLNAHKLGLRVFEARSRCGFFSPAPVQFPELTKASTQSAQGQKYIAICMPGESFSSDWVGSLWEIRNACTARGYIPLLFRQYTSNVYVTRKTLADMVLRDERKPELVLWVDDDNVATRDHFETLMDSMEWTRDADVMAGWCWIHNEQTNTFYPSCGVFAANGAEWRPFGVDFVRGQQVTGAECTGFPFVLMKSEALVKAGGPDAFLPILADTATGVMGEDLAWCKRALDAGINLYVDPKVKVLHMKQRSPEPFIAPTWEPKNGPLKFEAKAEPRIAAMLRVKNESRWIERVIKSILPLCDAGVYVLDDESTDGTRHIAQTAGAGVFPSPFKAMSLDESRDKNWLLDKVTASAHPDWILCIDGDEELAAGDDEKIREALRNATVDCFALRFAYLWDSPDQWRSDRWYSTFGRYSIFRPLPQFRFKSLYAKNGVDCHSGLHTGNAPADMQGHLIEGVRLLHYGYMHKQDRIRKYEYYNRIDPNNEIEDGYRHIVQGDIPQVPPYAVLRHAGPLELTKLHPATPPDWSVMGYTAATPQLECCGAD